MAKHNEIGRLGELIAQKFLMKQGFKIIETNFLRKWGEIDIVALKSGITYFVEVKSMQADGEYDVFENAHESKLEKQRRVIATYIESKWIGRVEKWEYRVIRVRLDTAKKIAYVRQLAPVSL